MLLVLISMAVLLTSCGQSALDYPQQEKSSALGAESTENLSSDIVSEESVNFQEVFDALEVPEKFAGCTRYVLVNDYDGDGRQEAFGFFGDRQEGNGAHSVVWNDMQIYYINSDGTIFPAYTETNRFEDIISGTPASVEGGAVGGGLLNCYFRADGQTFAVFDVSFGDDMYYSTMSLSVYQGSYTLSLTEGTPMKTEDGRIVVSAWDEEIEYVIKDGELVKKSSSSDDDSSEENSITETAASANSSTARSAWNDYIKSTGENELYFIPGDYDGDGTEEAYGITGEMDSDGYANNVCIYFIASTGMIFIPKDSTWGYLRTFQNPDTASETCFLNTGKQKFIVWEEDGGGSASVSFVFGTQHGVTYQPEVSGKYQWFHPETDGTYIGTTSDFSKGYHDYIDHTFVFDEATGEFLLKE